MNVTILGLRNPTQRMKKFEEAKRRMRYHTQEYNTYAAAAHMYGEVSLLEEGKQDMDRHRALAELWEKRVKELEGGANE